VSLNKQVNIQLSQLLTQPNRAWSGAGPAGTSSTEPIRR
jgi:hypothetical protein